MPATWIVVSYTDGTGRFSAPKTIEARSLRMTDNPIVISSGGMCPVARIGRKAAFSISEPSPQAAAIPQSSATGQGRWYTPSAK